MTKDEILAAVRARLMGGDGAVTYQELEVILGTPERKLRRLPLARTANRRDVDLLRVLEDGLVVGGRQLVHVEEDQEGNRSAEFTLGDTPLKVELPPRERTVQPRLKAKKPAKSAISAQNPPPLGVGARPGWAKPLPKTPLTPAERRMWLRKARSAERIRPGFEGYPEYSEETARALHDLGDGGGLPFPEDED
jgi:hypothetical protein